MTKATKTYIGVEGDKDEDGNILQIRQSKWWIMDALGRRVYIYKRTRWEAQEVVDNYYGKRHYTVNQV